MSRLGRNAKLYRVPLTGATESAPVEVTKVKDLNLDMTSEEFDITTRASGNFNETAVTGLQAELTFKMPLPDEGSTDANLAAIQSAYLNCTTVRMMALNGARTVAGNEGLKSDFVVSKCSLPQNLKDAQEADITLKPGKNTSWVTIEAES